MKDIRERIADGETFKPSLRPPFPENMLVELTNGCNHQCIFCANKKKPRKIGQIKEELLDRILVEAYSLGTRSLGYYTTGEPLISANLEKYIARAKEIGYNARPCCQNV
jgi:molybdenum cofactor biosynthesis enzyme MoaA